jgi:hypothetical protein
MCHICLYISIVAFITGQYDGETSFTTVVPSDSDMCPNNAGAFASILWQSHFETKDTEFDKTLDKKTDFVNGGIKNYLESTGQTLNNINGKVARAQIWRFFLLYSHRRQPIHGQSSYDARASNHWTYS